MHSFPPAMKRRTACKLALGGVAAAWTSRVGATAPTVASRIVDTHTHFYDPTRPQGVPWPTPGTPLFRPVYPRDWLALAEPHGIRETVVVEASKWKEDNDWILALAEKEKCIVGFVGNLQPGDTTFPEDLKRLAGNPIFRGIRVSGHSLLDHWEKLEFLAGLKRMAELGLSLDVNGLADPAVIARLAERVPALRIVIDHCGNCGDPQKLKPVWQEGMLACGKQPQVFCKVSGLPEMTATPPGEAPTDTAYYRPVLDHLWTAFGEDRLIFGSNWPVSDKGTSYDGVFKIVSGYFAGRGAEACEKYFWKNSRVAYRWIERK